MSPDEQYLYVTNGNLNNIAVVKLTGTNHGDQVIGLIPSGWYPNSVAVSSDGTQAYVVKLEVANGRESKLVLCLRASRLPDLHACQSIQSSADQGGIANHSADRNLTAAGA